MNRRATLRSVLALAMVSPAFLFFQGCGSSSADSNVSSSAATNLPAANNADTVAEPTSTSASKAPESSTDAHPPAVSKTIDPTAPTSVTTSEPADPAVSAVTKEGDSQQATSKKIGATESSPGVSKKVAAGEVVAINFEDLNLQMQADIVYRPWMLTERVKELDGARIRISGVIHPSGQSQTKNLRDFILLKNKECKFGKGGQADHLVHVLVKSELGPNFTEKMLEIEGQLKVNPYQGPDGNTWSMYDVEATSFKELRR